ncbi:MAG: CHAT domain-containing protein [Acidobacteriota bacterium]
MRRRSRICVAAVVGVLALVGVISRAAERADSAALMLHRAAAAAAAMDYGTARELYASARQRAARADDQDLEARALLGLSAVLRQSGAGDRALEPVDAALALLADQPPTATLVRAYGHRAEAVQARGEVGGVDVALARGRNIARRLDDPGLVAEVDAVAAVLATRRGEDRMALELGRRALPAADGPAAMRAWSAIAYAQHRLGRWRSARASYDQVIEKAWAENDQRTLGFAYCNRAEVDARLGVETSGVEDLLRAIERLERGAGALAVGDAERAAFLDRDEAAYDRLVRALVDAGRPRAAFDVAEQLHGRALLDTLGAGVGEGDCSEHRQLVRRLGRARLDLDSAAPSARAGVLRSITDLERRLRALSADRPPSERVPPATIDDVQEALAADESLIAYWVAEERTIAWVVDAETVRVVQIPVARDRLEDRLDAYLSVLRSPSRAVERSLLADEAAHLAAGRQLHDWLIAPIGPSAARRWIVIPDGRLHELPFEALIQSCNPGSESASRDPRLVHAAYADCQYVGHRRALSYAPSAGVMLRLRERARERPPAPRPLVAMAPTFAGESATAAVRSNRGPLRHSADEVRRIGRFFTDAEVLIGPRAQEARLDAGLASVRRLHLATHGLVDDGSPFGGGLLLAPGQDDDGLLLVPEVRRLDLQADLVTISACRSGRGRPSRAEGSMGLSRAFLAAGASAVVASLWDVDDRSTALLMERFYLHLAAGERPSEALRQARVWLASQRGETRRVFETRPVSYAHPRYWAGFVVVGAE